MTIQQSFTWVEYLKYRTAQGMPPLSHEISVGNSQAFVIGKFEDLVVKEQAKLVYKWSFEDNVFSERIYFNNSGASFTMNVSVTREQKEAILNNWYDIKNVVFFGKITNIQEEFVVKKFGWNMLNDIQNLILEKNRESGSRSDFKVVFGGTNNDVYMSKSIEFGKMSPKLNFHILDGGYYYLEISLIDREYKIFFTEEISLEKEQEMSIELKKYAEFIHSFLFDYIPTEYLLEDDYDDYEDEETEEDLD